MSAVRVIANVTGILLAAPIRLPLKLINTLRYVRAGAEIATQIEVPKEEKPKKRVGRKKAQTSEHEQ